MLLLTLAAALSQPMPMTVSTAAAFGDAPIVCNPDSSKSRACHADRHHAQVREHQARKERLAAAREQDRAASRLSMQDTAGRPVSD